MNNLTARDYIALQILCSGELNPDMTDADMQKLVAQCYRLADIMIAIAVRG